MKHDEDVYRATAIAVHSHKRDKSHKVWRQMQPIKVDSVAASRGFYMLMGIIAIIAYLCIRGRLV